MKALAKKGENLKTVTSSRIELEEEIIEIKRAEGELIQSVERYHALFNSGNDAIFVHHPTKGDMPGKFIEVNDVACERLGYARAELLNLSPSDIAIYDGDLKEIIKKLRSYKRTIFESVFVAKDGRKIPVEINSRIFDMGGQETVLSIARDITERKLAEKELQKNRDYLEKLHNSIGDSVFSVKLPERIIEHVNTSVEAIFGYKPEECIGKNTEMFYLSNEDYLAFGRKIKKALKQKKGFLNSELVVKRKNGEEFPAEITTSFLREDGRATRIISIVRDITERKQAEEEVEQSEEKFRSIFTSALDGIVLVDSKTGRIVDLNPEFEKQTGRKAKQLKKMKVWELRPPDKIALAREKFFEIRKKGKGGSSELELQKPDGEIVPVEFTSKKVKILGKEYFQSISRDVTEQKRAEEELHKFYDHLEELVEERTHELELATDELIRKEKLANLGQLSGSIAHEIRNPLGIIGNSVYYLKMKLEGADEKVRRHLDILQGEVLRTNVIISDLLDFSKVAPLSRVKGNLNGVINDALKEVALPDYVTVKTSLDSDLPGIIIDQGQIRQVFLNLFSNAVQAMPEGGTLKITTGTENGFVKAQVTDTGEGIQKENLKKIFEPLFTTKAKGTGLGLAIIKGIVDKHNGRIEVKSRAKEGTTFTVRLPVID